MVRHIRHVDGLDLSIKQLLTLPELNEDGALDTWSADDALDELGLAGLDLSGILIDFAQLLVYDARNEGHKVVHLHEGHSDDLFDYVSGFKRVYSCRCHCVLIRQYLDFVRHGGDPDVQTGSPGACSLLVDVLVPGLAESSHAAALIVGDVPEFLPCSRLVKLAEPVDSLLSIILVVLLIAGEQHRNRPVEAVAVGPDIRIVDPNTELTIELVQDPFLAQLLYVERLKKVQVRYEHILEVLNLESLCGIEDNLRGAREIEVAVLGAYFVVEHYLLLDSLQFLAIATDYFD